MATTDARFRRVGADEPIDAIARACCLAFGVPPEGVERWLAYAGRAVLRRLDAADGSLTASMMLIPMGLFLGGRSIQVQGVAGVTVVPERRGGGAATALMEHALREAREEGVPLSCLYSAKQPLYRRVGYELAGVQMEHTLDLKLAKPEHRGGADRVVVRPYEERDFAGVAACYRRFAAGRPGHLDRGDDRNGYLWSRIIDGRINSRVYGFVAESAGETAGYVFYQHTGDPSSKQLWITDIASTDGATARALAAFLAGHGSVHTEAGFCAGVTHPLLFELSELVWRSRVVNPWHIRVVDVPAALRSRGYDPALNTAFTIEITDALFPGNAGPWSLRLRDGACEVARPGAATTDGAVRMDVRALASLYTGLRSGRELESAGLAAGPASGIAALDSAFRGELPSMPDGF